MVKHWWFRLLLAPALGLILTMGCATGARYMYSLSISGQDSQGRAVQETYGYTGGQKPDGWTEDGIMTRVPPQGVKRPWDEG